RGGPRRSFHLRDHTFTESRVVDLHPSGFIWSEASGVSSGQQVGWGYGLATGNHRHALLWRGSAVTVVDLHPRGFDGSEALGASGGQQVGWGSTGDCLEVEDSLMERVGCDHNGMLWRGAAGSLVDLHASLPPGFAGSYAAGIDSNGDIVGVAWGPATNNRSHAFLWTRNVNAKPSPVPPVDKFTTLDIKNTEGSL